MNICLYALFTSYIYWKQGVRDVQNLESDKPKFGDGKPTKG